jgi:hypothetical protein
MASPVAISVRGGREPRAIVPTATVTRLASEVPPLGARYAFSDGGRTFLGVVTNVVPLGEKHATVTLELMPDEHRRLIDQG